MVRWTLILWFALVGSAFGTTTELHPALYDVTGVAGNDTLNVRRGPGTDFEIIGVLSPLARNVEVVAVNDELTWGRVNVEGQSGWASLKFLARQPNQLDGNFPAVTACFGNEPFWDVTFFGADRISYRDPVTERVFFDEVWQSYGANRIDRFAFGTDSLTATLRREECSDGMSDRLMGISIDLLREGESRTLLSGCCTIAP